MPAEPEVLDDALGTLTVHVQQDGGPASAALDVFEAYRRYCDAVGEATADDRDATARAWAERELGFPVSGLTAYRLWNRVNARVQSALGKPGTAGSTASGSDPAPSPPPPPAC